MEPMKGWRGAGLILAAVPLLALVIGACQDPVTGLGSGEALDLNPGRMVCPPLCPPGPPGPCEGTSIPGSQGP